MDLSIIQNLNNLVVIEGMTAISALISAIETSVNDRKIFAILFDKKKASSKRRELSFLRIKAKQIGYEVILCDRSEIECRVSGGTHGGIIALCSERRIPSLSLDNIKKDGIYYMFEGIEDPYNFGYVIRSIYAAGADGIIMSPRNWLSAAATVARSSAGTSELIDIFIAEPENAVDLLKSTGFTVVCAGIRDSETIYDAALCKPLLVVVGGEKRGISRAVLDKADKVVRIDYGRAFKGSLPSVAAASVIAFEILRKTKQS